MKPSSSEDFLYLSGNTSETENLPRMVGKFKYIKIRPVYAFQLDQYIAEMW